MNNNLYARLNDLMNGRTRSEFSHDEQQESDMVNAICAWRKVANDIYYRSLLNPEVHPAKIPSRLPVESAIASLHDNFTITPNSSGLFLLVIDPFKSTGWLYQDDALDGQGTAGTVTTLTFGQNSSIIDQWRLVSSSLILRYYGDFNTMKGLFVAATTSNVSNATASYYANFQNIEDLTNKQVLRCVDGVKLIYSPMDEKATDFQPQSTYTGTHPCNWQYLFVVCGYMLPNSTGCIRADFFRNIEYTSVPAYKEYIVQDRDLPSDFNIPSIDTTTSAAPPALTIGTKKSFSFGDMVRTAISKASPVLAAAATKLSGSLLTKILG